MEISKTLDSILHKIEEISKSSERMPQNISSEFITQKKAALLLNVTVQTLINWRRNGIVKAKHIGRRVYYSLSDLMKAAQVGGHNV